MDVAPSPPPPPSSKFSAAAEPAPRDNRAFFARVLIAALLIGVLAVAAIFAVTRLREGDDNRDAASVAATATRSAELNAMAAALGTVTPTVVPPSETATTEPPTATVPPPTNTPPADTPTPKPEDQGDSAAVSGGDNPEPTKKPSVPKIGDMLPAGKDVPDGFQQTDDGKLSKDDVAGSFSDPEDAAAKLDEWGWKENAYRIYEIPADADHAADDVTYLYVSIHRFDSSGSASAALPYFAQAVEEARGLREVNIDDQLGDEMIVAAGPDDRSNEVTLYIRTGNRIVRVTAFADSGDSTDEAVALAKKVLAK
jgi:type II secretory pathway pseudopilin PulG